MKEAEVAPGGREKVDKDPPLVSFAMSLHSLQDQVPQQKRRMPPDTVVGDLKKSPAKTYHELDLKWYSYTHSAILHRLDLIERLLETTDDGTVIAEVRNRALSWDQSTCEVQAVIDGRRGAIGNDPGRRR